MVLSLEKCLRNASWQALSKNEFKKDYFRKLESFLQGEYEKNKKIYPAPENIFAALNLSDIKDIKVVILGQDPYHGPNQAHGLSFSVPAGVPFPPSLQNIMKELASDAGRKEYASGDLSGWARQGVLLLNSVLTVEAGHAASHQKRGWEDFTNHIIALVNEHGAHVVFILWGAYAQKKAALVDRERHLVIESVHPSPLSAHRGFFGSKPFSKANAWLERHHIKPIQW